jgi:hypothetical protein
MTLRNNYTWVNWSCSKTKYLARVEPFPSLDSSPPPTVLGPDQLFALDLTSTLFVALAGRLANSGPLGLL